jgi:hypothetical protein
MKIIEDWIDSKLTSLVEGGGGYIILSSEDVTDLAQALGMQNPGNLYMKEAVRDYVYYLTDMHKDYFQQKLEEFGVEYTKQQRETNRVESELCQ